MWEQINGLFLRLKQARTDGTWSTRPHYVCRLSSKACTSSKASPTRRWRTAKAGSTCRSAASSSAPAPPRRCSISTSTNGSRLPPNHVGVGRPAALVLGARGLLPLLHRRPPPGAHRRVPAAQSRVPALGALRRRARRVRAAHHRAARRPRHRRPRRAARRPAARLARLRPGGRDPQRGSARLPRGHRPLLRPDPRGRVPDLLTYPIESALPA